MNDFDQEMKSALRRDAAPPDFAAKVLARVTQATPAQTETGARVVTMPLWRRQAAWALAAGLSIAAIVPPAVVEYRQRRETRALTARRELLVALAITRTKLQQTRERIQRTTRHTL